MTLNQLRYQELKETQRSNLAKELETNRSNIAKELETARSNRTNERETNRSNLEKETMAHNQYLETVRYNKNRNATDYMNAGANILKAGTSAADSVRRWTNWNPLD